MGRFYTSRKWMAVQNCSASERAASLVRAYNLAMPARATELLMRYDENSLPIGAKCSQCGEQMPQAEPRITNSIDNVAWFAAQFRLHVERNHLLVWTGKSRVQ